MTWNRCRDAFLSMTTHRFLFHRNDEVNEILAQFAEQFGKTAGKDLKIAEKEGKNMMIVKIDTTMSQEAYRLNISKKKIEITAATPNGVRYALQTVKQLLPEASPQMKIGRFLVPR